MELQDLNVAIEQFKAMDIMHQILRKRHLDGKALPTDEDGMKAAIQSEGPKVLSKSQKKGLAESQRKRMKGMGRGR